ncbi:vacuolar protein sorting-associated protein 37B-like [Chelonus insularis]|uniref:vacuolar protein sorting-associated protein 37B-like n=1 Tax=Chelonus insularis TaxID=460826 RepID=UPI00158890F2|nr:vacuolar protein sorting-associated protein 37B-like [Chelonus insularis]XP_034936712.1 vacuolar protein sorting-associated protein 37B-like [Chelonus insularis]XP_034936713.1 vacuolar protein sorting-associated protein 37B-like [Chelonus insularis]
MYNPTQEPDIPAALSKLHNLSNDELKELLNDEGKFEDIVKHVQQFKELETEKEMLMASNRSLAEYNLSKQPELDEGKKTLHELGERGTAMCSSVQEKLSIIKEKSGSMSIDTAMELLQAAAAECEEESEKLAEKFLSGDYEVDEFLEQFLTRRKLMHLRKVKVDKMRELRRKAPLKTSSGGPGYPTNTNFPGIIPSVPYPTGSVSMPMPISPNYRPFI